MFVVASHAYHLGEEISPATTSAEFYSFMQISIPFTARRLLLLHRLLLLQVLLYALWIVVDR